MDCSPSIRPLDGSDLSELALKDGYDLLFSVAKPGAIELLQQHLDRIPDATNLSAIAADLVQDNLLGLGMAVCPSSIDPKLRSLQEPRCTTHRNVPTARRPQHRAQPTSGGFRSIQGRAASICAESRKSIASLPNPATSWIASGNPRDAPGASTWLT